MSKRYTGNYIVKWLDQDNNKKQKTYQDYSMALKAKKWLLDNCITYIDIAVEVNNTSNTKE